LNPNQINSRRAGKLLRPAAIALVYLATLLAAVWMSTPRRVGDGGEYFVMATQLAALQPPSLTRDELDVAAQRLKQVGSGFEAALIQYPNLVGPDGRQEFLHYWLYPLFVAPLVPVAHALDLHPNWAFTLTNLLFLTGAVFVIARLAPAIVVVAGFFSPVIWWADKAHTEAFLFSAVSVAAMLFQTAPSAAMLVYGLAGAQNAAIGLTFPLFAMFALAHANGSRRAWISAALAGATVASPFVYTWMRLGRFSPMAEYAQRTQPTIAQLAAFVAEPNVGLLANAPVYALAVVAGVWLAFRARRQRPPLFWWPVVLQIVLLVVWSQNPNMNHGGTPGVNRWVLSLLAVALPWIGPVYLALGTVGRSMAAATVLIVAGWSAFQHVPSRPEQYLRPAGLAETVWQAGWLDVTPAEVFAERSQHREPPSVPMAVGGCDVVLVSELQWPLQCVPVDAVFPAACHRAGSMCYAVSSGEQGTRIIPTPNNGFFFFPSVPSWPATGPLATGVRTLLLELDPHARQWGIEPASRWIERATDADGLIILGRERGVFLYISRTGNAPELRLHAGGFTAASVHTLTPVSTLGRSAAAEDRAVVRPPARATNIAVTLSSPSRFVR
jgi:hypothetical protein